MKAMKKLRVILISLCCALLCACMGFAVSFTSVFTAKAETTVNTTTDMYCDGASIRLADDGKSGIRFHVRVAGGETKNYPLDVTTLTTGTLVIPTDKLTGELTKDTANKAKVNTTGEWTEVSEIVIESGVEKTYYYMESVVYVYNIPSYDTANPKVESAFSFRGYYEKDGVTYYTDDTDSRSLSYVALRAKIDDNNKKAEDSTAGYQSNENGKGKLDILNSYLPTKLADTHKKFVNKDNYVYRVGNGNAVSLSSLLDVDLLNGLDVTSFGSKNEPIFSVETSEGNAVCNKVNVKKDEKGIVTSTTLTFTGTGVVKLTIENLDEYTIGDSQTTTEMLFEVVDATNVTTYSELKDDTNSVLLNDITMSSGGTYRLTGNKTLYGNGFTFDATNGAYAGVEYDYESYVIYLENSNLDNVSIVGKVYTELGGTKSDNYNRALIMSGGDCKITNCYLSNCASPIRNGGNLELVNTTLKGGAYANLDLRNGHLILDNVTTINQSSSNDKGVSNGQEVDVVGLGIVVYQEGGGEELKITIKNQLNQYNYLSQKYADSSFTDTYRTVIKSVVFGENFTDYQFNDGTTTWVNTGIISMNDYFSANDLTDERADKLGYTGKSETITVMAQSRDCYVYTFKPSQITSAPEYATAGQGIIAPTNEFDYTTKNYLQKTEGSNDYCYEEGGTVYISMDEGDTFNWDASILTVTKVGQLLDYTVSMNGTDYTGKSIAFNTVGNYQVTYSYTDSNNYKLENGELITYKISYTKTVNITVAVVKRQAKHAEFSFGANGTAYSSKTVTIGDKTYVMPNVTATVDGKIGSITVSGTTVYYPITEMYTSDGKTSHYSTWYACFPIFKDALQIIDYADSGTGNSVTYNQSTVTTVNGIPSTLKATNPTSAFLYSMNATNYPPPTDPTAVSGAVCYTCNRNGLTAGQKRDEMTITAEYTYTDNAGTVYYYYIGYHCVQQKACIIEGTLITLADGTQKAVEDLVVGDMLLVFNHYTGKYDVKPLVINAHAEEEAQLHNVLNVKFSNGVVWRIAGIHGIFDCTLNEYVMISAENIDEYVGHTFYYTDGQTGQKVALTDYYETEEFVKIYSPATLDFANYFANGLLNAPPLPDTYTAGQMNYFDFDENMMYYEASMQADIEKYGLYTYEDFADYITEEIFNALPFKYFKISVGKGLMTWEEIMAVINMLWA